MPVVKCKPTSPGRRHVVKIVHLDLHKGEPYAPLTAPKSKTGGRNNKGRITRRHAGGGHKQKYRIIDFKRNRDGIPAKVERLEYDPNRSALIALLLYADGVRTYIIAPNKVKAGDTVVSGDDASIKVGNCLPLRNVPLGSTVHCVELKPGKGAQVARSAGPLCSWLLVMAPMQRFVFAQAKCAKCCRIAAQYSARCQIRSTACVSSVKPVLSAGEAFAQPFAVLR